MSKLPDSGKQPLLSVQEEDPDNLYDDIQYKVPLQGATLENLDEAYESPHDDGEEEDEVENENKAPIRRFGSQMGLFSKFTNAPTLDEFAIAGLLEQIEEKPEEVVAETAPPPLQSMWSFRGSMYDSEIAEEMIAKREEYNRWYKGSIMAVIFSTQFAGALELVYISPLFNRMSLPPLLDATVWIFPVFFITLATPFINIFASHLQFERFTHMLMMALSIVGCLIFAFLDQFLPLITTDPDSMRLWTIYLGFIAFCLLDVSNEMTTLIQNKMVLADEKLDTKFNNQLSAVASVAKILAYLTGTIEAFGGDFSNSIIPRNLDLCFIIAAILLFTALIMAALYQTAPTKGYRGSLIKKIKQLQWLHFLPPFRRIFRNTKKLKLIVVSHFFGSAGVLMLTVYVTLWVGFDVFSGDGRAPADSKEYHDFQLGVSWGAFSLFLASILSGITKYVIYKATLPGNVDKKRIRQLYIGSLLLGSLITILIQFGGPSTYWFLALTLTGPALEAFHVLPGILGDLAEIEETKKHLGHYRHLLSFSLFYAQVLMFFVLPLFFLFNPDRDDNLYGMLSAGSSMLLAAVIGIFI